MADVIIDPENITDINRDYYDLETFWVFSVCVAGKKAKTTANCVRKFFEAKPDDVSAFEYISAINESPGKLITKIRNAGFGQYNRISKCLLETIERGIDLRNASVEELESIYGVGPKTARFFVMHSRPNVRCAALDVHILKFLKLSGYDAPKNTPTGKKYRELEEAFLYEADKRNMEPGELDLYVWTLGSRGELEKWVQK